MKVLQMKDTVAIDPPSEAPLFPARIYVFNADGTYGEPTIVPHMEALKVHMTTTIRHAIRNKVEVRVTDPGDLLLFHTKDGKILFDGKEYHPDGKEVKDLK